MPEVALAEQVAYPGGLRYNLPILQTQSEDEITMYTDINSEDYRQQFASEDVQFIDVREADEYAEAHIPGAINIPLSEFQQRMDEISEDAPLLLVCRTGVRSAQAAIFMASMGYDEVYNLEEGTAGWMKKGYAVERGPLE